MTNTGHSRMKTAILAYMVNLECALRFFFWYSDISIFCEAGGFLLFSAMSPRLLQVSSLSLCPAHAHKLARARVRHTEQLRQLSGNAKEDQSEECGNISTTQIITMTKTTAKSARNVTSASLTPGARGRDARHGYTMKTTLTSGQICQR
jgi:hypothetical protein